MLSTHVIIGLTIGNLLMLPISWIVLGALIPDIDYLIGVEHRTLTHSILFFASALIIYKLWGKHAGLAYSLGLFSHLTFDLITPMGVQLLYPLPIFYSFNLVSSMDSLPNIAIMLACLVFIINRKSIQESLINLSKGVVLKGTAVLCGAFITTSLLFPVSNCSNNIMTINEVLSRGFNEEEVLVNGTICSDINPYTSKAGNNYQVFRLCQGNSSILIWKGYWVAENNLSRGDLVSVCALYTEEYDEPELYYVRSVVKS